MIAISLTDYEYQLCSLFSKESAKTQQRIEFGQRSTRRRSVEEIARDNMIGKMAEVAVAKTLRRDFGLHLPVNYEIYPNGECDDNDIVINRWSFDIKSTRKGSYLLFERNKVLYRQKNGTLPDVVMMCRTPWDDRNDCPSSRTVDLIGCIGMNTLIDPASRNVYRLKAGDFLPETRCRLQADNYAVRFENLADFHSSIQYILTHEPYKNALISA